MSSIMSPSFFALSKIIIMLLSFWTRECHSVNNAIQPISFVKLMLMRKCGTKGIIVVKSVGRLIWYSWEIVQIEVVMVGSAILIAMQISAHQIPSMISYFCVEKNLPYMNVQIDSPGAQRWEKIYIKNLSDFDSYIGYKSCQSLNIKSRTSFDQIRLISF